MDYNNSNRLLFICALPGGSGYQLGRLVSCFNNVHWYENKRNGKMPWNFFHSDSVKGKDISPYHYDRRTEKNMIPLVGERVEKFWEQQDIETYYRTVWPSLMDLAGADEIIKQDRYISWVIHDDPKHISNLFPNAKIINLIGEDVNSIVDRYKKTTALFPAVIENTNIKPKVKNSFTVSLDDLKNYNMQPSYRDLWAWQTFRIPKYFESLNSSYDEFLTAFMLDLRDKKNVQDTENILSTSWTSFNLDRIKTFLGSESIDSNYKLLLESGTL